MLTYFQSNLTTVLPLEILKTFEQTYQSLSKYVTMQFTNTTIHRNKQYIVINNEYSIVHHLYLQ